MPVDLPPSVTEVALMDLWEQLDAARLRLARLVPEQTLTRFEQRRLRAMHARAIESLDAYHGAIEDALAERGVDPLDERFEAAAQRSREATPPR
jgi:hypothetical protein